MSGDDNVRDFPAGETGGLATCNICGQTLTVDMSRFATQAEADDFATGICDCPDGDEHRERSRSERERDDSLRKASEQIDALFGSGAAQYGLEPAIEAVREMLNAAAMLVYDEEIKHITIGINSCAKAKVFKTVKDKLMIRRSDTAVLTQEI